MKEWNITQIESITHAEAEILSEEKIIIKEHECFFVDFGGYFGYSVIVFKDEKHIYYANDYELHHESTAKELGKSGLKKYYIDAMRHKLYTDSELMENISSYDEYREKNYFLRNYWIMRYNHISIFGNPDDPKAKDFKTKYPYYNNVCFCYVADNSIVEQANKYLNHLEAELHKIQTEEHTFREMIRYELANHEAGITCDYSDALGALGLTFEELSENQQKIVTNELRNLIHEC